MPRLTWSTALISWIRTFSARKPQHWSRITYWTNCLGSNYSARTFWMWREPILLDASSGYLPSISFLSAIRGGGAGSASFGSARYLRSDECWCVDLLITRESFGSLNGMILGRNMFLVRNHQKSSPEKYMERRQDPAAFGDKGPQIIGSEMRIPWLPCNPPIPRDQSINRFTGLNFNILEACSFAVMLFGTASGSRSFTRRGSNGWVNVRSKPMCVTSAVNVKSVTMANYLLELSDGPRFEHVKLLFCFILVSSTLFWVIRAFTFGNGPSRKRENSPDLEKPKLRNWVSPGQSERVWGTWIASDFKRPAAKPYPGWDVNITEPLPYRPFKWGAYFITMGLKTMQWDDWIELDNRYAEYHAIKTKRIEERGEKCNKTAPEAYAGAIELLEEL